MKFLTEQFGIGLVYFFAGSGICGVLLWTIAQLRWKRRNGYAGDSQTVWKRDSRGCGRRTAYRDFCGGYGRTAQRYVSVLYRKFSECVM